MGDERQILAQRGIQPSAQRLAVAEYVFHTHDHPGADQVWTIVRQSFPAISRATVYNTLNLFVEKGLLRELHLAEDRVVFDSNLRPHHHFVDEETGRIHDIDWERVQVCNMERLREYEVRDYQVVMRGKLRSQ
ncbi:MAG TPA: transcriptional repressor [Thermoanaerobaculia bacterium]